MMPRADQPSRQWDRRFLRVIYAFGFLLCLSCLTGILVRFVRSGWSMEFAKEAFVLGILFFGATAGVFARRAWRCHRDIVSNVDKGESPT